MTSIGFNELTTYFNKSSMNLNNLQSIDLSENEFYSILEKFKEDKIKEIKLPKEKKLYSFKEDKNRPFIINFIEKIRNEYKRKK